MTYTYQPRGVCSQRMTVELDHGIIRDVRVEGGCNGNLQGISRLVIGMPATEAIEKMKGIRCGGKPSSCRISCRLPWNRHWPGRINNCKAKH